MYVYVQASTISVVVRVQSHIDPLYIMIFSRLQHLRSSPVLCKCVFLFVGYACNQTRRMHGWDKAISIHVVYTYFAFRHHCKVVHIKTHNCSHTYTRCAPNIYICFLLLIGARMHVQKNNKNRETGDHRRDRKPIAGEPQNTPASQQVRTENKTQICTRV